MIGIEACFTARIVSDPENKISAAGNAWMRFNAAIGEGDDAQFCQVKIFGDVAAKLSGQIAKGSKVYCEGRLKLDKWQKDGQERSGLSLAAWRCDLIAQIGKNKPKRTDTSGTPSFAGSVYQREAPKIVGLDDFADDRLPF
ncbi:MAG: single-stranded DNA-binding protein [Rhodomicrobium sp.]